MRRGRTRSCFSIVDFVDLQAYKLLGTGGVSACLDQLHFPSIDVVDHMDAQSVDNMVQLCGVDATTALRNLPREKATLSTVATAFWMEQTRRYLLVFRSRRWSLEQRVEEAARIVVFLRIFREHVRQSATLTGGELPVLADLHAHAVDSAHGTCCGQVSDTACRPRLARAIADSTAVSCVCMCACAARARVYVHACVRAIVCDLQAVLHILAHATLAKGAEKLLLDRLGSDICEDFFRCAVVSVPSIRGWFGWATCFLRAALLMYCA